MDNAKSAIIPAKHAQMAHLVTAASITMRYQAINATLVQQIALLVRHNQLIAAPACLVSI